MRSFEEWFERYMKETGSHPVGGSETFNLSTSVVIALRLRLEEFAKQAFEAGKVEGLAKRGLTEEQRTKVIDFLVDAKKGTMFGDGQEREYLLDGVHITGLNQLSDAELIDEFRQHAGDDETVATILGTPESLD